MNDLLKGGGDLTEATNLDLTPKEKAAILLISLGKEHSAQLYRYLGEDEIEQLTLAITTMKRVDPEAKELVLNEFYEICLTQKFITEGGIAYARDVLERALGTERAAELINRLSASIQVRPFEFIRKAEPAHVFNLIQNEYAQTIALVLSHMAPKQAADVLANLSPERQVEVINRIANMGSISPEYMKEAERILERRMQSMGVGEQTEVGGIDSVVSIINSVDRGTEKFLLESMELHDSDLADEIRKRLFVFEDVAGLSNQSIQRVLKEVDNSDLTLALKGAGEEVAKAIFSNLSKRLTEMIRDDMEIMGPVRVKDVEEAQQRIVNAVRKLEDAGEIVVSRGEGDDLIV